mmetsp:Transcript_136538/g.323386  ORF Transcript_136538/g.323386 Transcript_136538/m.323386 type:complete len:519 (-) Transcript_136538:299-1855(-)
MTFGCIAAVHVVRELLIEASLIDVAHVQEGVHQQLPELVPGCTRLASSLCVPTQLSPSETRAEVVVGQNVPVALGLRHRIEAGVVAILHSDRVPKDLLCLVKGGAQLLGLLKDPSHSVGVDVLRGPRRLGLGVVRVQLGPHAHEALGRRGTRRAANGFADLPGCVLEQVVHRVHCSEQQHDERRLLLSLVLLLCVLLLLSIHPAQLLLLQLLQTEESLRRSDVVVLAWPHSDLHSALAHQPQLLAQLPLPVLLLVLLADDVQLLHRQALELHEAPLRLIPGVWPKPPVADEPLHRQRVRLLVGLADLQHRVLQPAQRLVPVRARGRLPVHVPPTTRVVLQIQQHVLVVTRPLRVGWLQALHPLCSVLCGALSGRHQLCPHRTPASLAQGVKLLRIKRLIISIILALFSLIPLFALVTLVALIFFCILTFLAFIFTLFIFILTFVFISLFVVFALGFFVLLTLGVALGVALGHALGSGLSSLSGLFRVFGSVLGSVLGSAFGACGLALDLRCEPLLSSF